ncbi:MAG TPA: ATP-binding protein [Rhizomicrobium sp.]|nr:ATP-binding protein [Rhizomicrobium sp.]
MLNFHPFRAIKRALPRRLFGRSLLIIVTPVVLLQGVVTYAFFERHYTIMTARMARGVAADVAFLLNIEETYPPGKARDALLGMAAKNLGYQISFQPGATLEKPLRHYLPDLKDAITTTFTSQFGAAYPFTSRYLGDYVDVRVQAKDGVMRLLIPHKRLDASNVDVFILWMVGSSLLLLAVAILFLRNQVRPIERLARAADAFGKGNRVVNFKPYGATEVRRAAQAFITMRERIERYVQQRTEMLAAVSHDLKTPLTRLKLQLAMMGSADAEAMRGDVTEMEHMLDEYLDFARGESAEEAQTADLADIVSDAAAAAGRARGDGKDRVKVDVEQGVRLAVKRNALYRCTTNLIDNALKYGKHAHVTLKRNSHMAEIIVDDDGPGIAPERREEAFRPFHRLDEGRNLQAGGSGLGLAIARDIARAHGGDLVLGDSPMGGLSAVIKLPI